MTTEVRLDRLLGRTVLTGNNRMIGRIEEFRSEQRGSDCVVVEYVIGPLGLVERLGVGARSLLGLHSPGGYVARWDQVDLTDPDRPRLLCSVDELQNR
jgi:hypothetical protein